MLEGVDLSVLKFFGHMEKMDDRRFTSIIYRVEVFGGRGWGRPMKRYSEGQKGAFRAEGFKFSGE